MKTKKNIKLLGLVAVLVILFVTLASSSTFFKGSLVRLIRQPLLRVAGLPSPSIVSPTENQVYTNFPRTAAISWSPVVGATYYEVTVDCDLCGQAEYKSVSFSAQLKENSVTTSPLPGDNRYRVHVRALGPNGGKSSWSAYKFFSFSTGPAATQPVLGTPTVASPTENQVYTNYPRTAAISWSPVVGATYYEVTVDCDLCGQAEYKSLSFSAQLKENSVTTSPLPGDNRFRVRVRALGPNNAKGEWSEYRYFSYTTGPAAPAQQ